MMVIPIKWLPWLFLIAGVVTLAGGEAGMGLILIVVGGVWLFLRKKGNAGQSTQPGPSAGAPTTKAQKTIQQSPQAGQRPAFCPSCGAKTDSGAFFCTGCGAKLTH